MPNQVIPITELDKVGLIEDTPSVVLPPNAFSDCSNVRFEEGAIRKMPGEEVISFVTDVSDIVYIAYWRRPTMGDCYVVLNESSGNTVVSVYVINGSGELELDDISGTSITGTITGRAGGSWQHTEFNGGFNIVINDGLGTPYYLQEDAADPLPLPNWDSYQAQSTVIQTTYGGSDFDPNFPLGIVSDELADSSTDTSGIEVLVSIIPRNPADAIVNGVFYDNTRTVVDVGTISGTGTNQLEFNPTGASAGDEIRIILRQVPTVSVTAGVIRAYGNALVAGCLREVDSSDTTVVIRDMPGTIRTSDVAAPGQVPQNWNPFRDGVNTADEFVLATTGKVVDLVELQGILYVYTDSSIHAVQRSASPQIPFQVSPVTDSYGASNVGSVIEMDGKHVVVGSSDVYLFGGHPGNITSIVEGRVRSSLVSKDNTKVLRFNKYDELWFYTSEDSEIYIWNYRHQTWTKRNQRTPLTGVSLRDNLIFVEYDTNNDTSGDIYTVDEGYSTEDSFVERRRLAMTPEFDTEELTSVAFLTDGDGELAVEVLSTSVPGESVTFSDVDDLDDALIFDVEGDYKKDIRVHGRFLNYRLTHIPQLIAGSESGTGDGSTTDFTLTTTGFQDLSVEIDGVSEEARPVTETFEADGSAVTFTITDDHDVSEVEVITVGGISPDGTAASETFTGDGSTTTFTITDERQVSDISFTVDGVSSEEETSETFTGDGITTEFTIQDTRDVSSVSITIDDAEVDTADYTVFNKLIEFNTAPDDGAEIVVSFTAEEIPHSVSGKTITITTAPDDGAEIVISFTAEYEYSVSDKVITFVTTLDDGVEILVAYMSEIEYSVSGQVISFTTAPVNNAEITFNFNTIEDNGFALSGMQLDIRKGGLR